jgi:Flp pilus assembly protein TadG
MKKILMRYRNNRREDGQALVEFALLLPVLLIVLLAIMQFGLLFQNYLTLTDAVRAGSRVLAVGRGSSDPCAAAVTATKNAGGNLDLTGKVKTSITNDNANGTTCTTQGDLVQGNSATVTATWPGNVTILGVTFFSTNLSASATERIE